MTGPNPYAYDVTIPLPSVKEARQIIGDSFDPDATLNVVRMMAGTGDMFAPTIGLVKAIFSADRVDPKLRQMIILRAAKVLDAPYEWQANVPMSLNNGLTDADIAAAGSDGPVEGIDPDYVLVCRATDELSGNGTLDDATLRALLDRHGDTITRKLVLIIGWFNMLSLFLNGCRVPMETTDKIGDKRSPLE